ncbi:MAG: hypothetical protein WCT46_06590 [Candidatus Gracilibacteria bacterium]
MAALSVLWAGIIISKPSDNGDPPVAARIIEEARSNGMPKEGVFGLMGSVLKREVSPHVALKKVLTLALGRTKQPTDELLTALSNQIRNIEGGDPSLEVVESIAIDIWTRIMDQEDRNQMTNSRDLILLQGVSKKLHEKVLALIAIGNSKLHRVTM